MKLWKFKEYLVKNRGAKKSECFQLNVCNKDQSTNLEQAH